MIFFRSRSTGGVSLPPYFVPLPTEANLFSSLQDMGFWTFNIFWFSAVG
jgi:hypothetical protein